MNQHTQKVTRLIKFCLMFWIFILGKSRTLGFHFLVMFDVMQRHMELNGEGTLHQMHSITSVTTANFDALFTNSALYDSNQLVDLSVDGLTNLFNSTCSYIFFIYILYYILFIFYIFQEALNTIGPCILLIECLQACCCTTC